jgi:hypothetical protein
MLYGFFITTNLTITKVAIGMKTILHKTDKVVAKLGDIYCEHGYGGQIWYVIIYKHDIVLYRNVSHLRDVTLHLPNSSSL